MTGPGRPPSQSDTDPPASAGVAALLGDAHLRAGDAEVEAFVRFLETLPGDIRTLAVLGDLFATWVGRPELCRPHHTRVLEALARLRGRGCRLVYVEGNHDFFLAPLFLDSPFDLITPVSIDLPLAGRRVHLAHGDLVNTRDRQYRAWRALSKNRLFFRLFNMAPAGPRRLLVDALEHGMAGTNLGFKGGFPFEECERYARALIGEGAEVLVFGHFHEEMRIEYQEKERRGTVFVLPAWRQGHRYLRLERGVEPAFVSS